MRAEKRVFKRSIGQPAISISLSFDRVGGIFAVARIYKKASVTERGIYVLAG